MKIGIFTDVYYPAVNGVVTSIRMLESEMKKRGHEVYIFSPTKYEPAEDEKLYMLRSIPLFVAKKYNFRIAAFYSRAIAKDIKELNLDIIHTQCEFSIGLFGKIISRKYNIPFMHTYHTMWEDYMHYINPIKGGRGIYSKRFARVLSKNFLRKAECVIAPSNKTQKYLKYKCKIKNKPIYVVPTGIDITPFSKDNFKEEEKIELKKILNIDVNDKVILFLGRIAEEKSIDKIIKIMPDLFSKIKNAKLVIVGDGPSKEDLENMVVQLGIQDKVIFTGSVPWDKVPLYYSIGDVFVNASSTETQGLTFIEAMASGVPVVAKYAPNIAEFIHSGENGILVRNDKDFAKWVISLLNNKQLRSKIISNALITASQSSSEIFGDKLAEIYSHVIENYKIKKSEKAKKDKIKIIKSSISLLKRKLVSITKIYKKKKG